MVVNRLETGRTMTTQLTFQNTQFNVIDRNGQPWLRYLQIGDALGYSNPHLLNKVYQKHQDEFTDRMTSVIKLPSGGGEQETRIFSLRGAHLLAMLSRTKLAKEFRKWVLDVLDHEIDAVVSQPKAIPDKLTNEQLQTIKTMVKARVEGLPKDKQAKGAITCWSAIKSKFGTSYKEISPDNFCEALSLVARLTLEGELLGPEVPAVKAPLDINYSLEWWLAHNPALRRINEFNHKKGDSLAVPASVLNSMDSPSPINLLLTKLAREGYSVEACRLEAIAWRYHLESALLHIQMSHQRQKDILESAISFRLQ